MDTNTLGIICLLIIGYIIMGLSISGIIGNFTDIDLDDYIFAALLFWPIVLLVGGIIQLIRFVKAMFRGDCW